MKTNKLFSTKLYIDGLRQLSTIAIDSFAIMVIFCIIYFALTSSYDELGSVIIVFSELFCFIFIPLMAFYILRFVHKRNSSDFYYSIPYSRVCISLSYLASVSTYSLIMAILIIPSLTSKYSIPDRFIYFAGLFVTYLLVCAVIYLAWSLTNTLFSQLVLTGLIAFLPQAILIYISDCIYSSCSFLDENHRSIFLSGELNLFTYNLGFTNTRYNFIPGIIYTLLLSIVYFIIAIILTKKKCSENAGSEKNNKMVRILTGCIISLYICLPAIEGIAYYIYYSHNIGLSILGVILIYIAAISAYFIYQFLATRSFKVLKSSLIGIPVLVFMNLLLITTILIASNKAYSFTPEADEIDYVQFTGKIYLSDYSNTYYSNIINNIKIDDIQTKNAISDELKSNIDEVKNFYTSSDYDSYFYLEDHINLRILICSDEKKYYRRLKIHEDDYYDIVVNAMYENEKFIKSASDLPDSKYIYDILNALTNNNKEYSKEDLYEIYEVYRSELAALSIEEQREIIEFAIQINNNHYKLSNDEFEKEYNDKYILTVGYETDTEENVHSLFINITEKTPKAYALCQKIFRKE